MLDYGNHSIEELLMVIIDKDTAYAALEQRCAELVTEVNKLNEQVNKFQRIVFGKKSEKLKDHITDVEVIAETSDPAEATSLKPEDGQVDENAPSQPLASPDMHSAAPVSKEKPKRVYKNGHAGRHKFDPDIIRVYEYEDPEGEPGSFGEFVEEVVSEQLVVEVNTYVLVKVRRKYVKNGIFSIAKISANNIFFKHRLHVKTVAFALMMRYALHTPYYRILSLITEPTLTYNTLVETACKGADALLPLAPVLLQEVKTCKSPHTAIGIDESTFDVMDTPKKIEVFKNATSSKGQHAKEQQDTTCSNKVIHTGRVWVLINPESGLFYCHYTATREKKHPEEFLKDYNGPITSDAYAAYLSMAKSDKFSIILMLCWAHARRHFTDLILNNKKPDPVALEAVRLIGLLYKIERKIKDKSLEEQLEARKESRKILLEKIKPYLEAKKKLYTPKESMYDAIDYILKNWPYFIKYTEILGGRIDNNITELNIRPTTLNRKNSLFFGSVKCAAGSAIMFSLIQSCKLNKVNILDYLTDVLGRIATHPKDRLAELLPHKWKNSLPQKTDT